MTELWGEETLNRIAQGRLRVRGLRELTSTFLPRTMPSTGDHADWPLSGFAMLARACGTAESALALAVERRATDAGALSRTLFEEVVTFAWIAIDPAANAQAWVRWDRRQRIKLDNDLVDCGAPGLLDPQVREQFEALIASGPMMPEDLPQRTVDADAHWAPRVDAIEPDPTSERSFRGMYRIVYRTDSQYAHAAVRSVEPFVVPAETAGQFRVVPVETDPGPITPFTRVPMLYALALLVAEPALGLPGIQAAIDGVFAS
jgi:Family of unknown function (DUF5677)